MIDQLTLIDWLIVLNDWLIGQLVNQALWKKTENVKKNNLGLVLYTNFGFVIMIIHKKSLSAVVMI